MQNITTNKLLTRSQYLNLLTIDLLEKVGNNEPTQKEIDTAETLVGKICKSYKDVPFALPVIKKLQKIILRKFF